MVKFTFKGGVHPDYNKITQDVPIEPLPLPKELYVPVLQHLGKPAKIIVKRGEKVKKGQIIAEADGFISANIHAPTSGKVKKIWPVLHPVTHVNVDAIVIEPDGEDIWADEIVEDKNYKDISPKEIVERVKKAGIVGLGGATFPTHVKLSPPPDKPIDTVIINGAECEPYLTADDRLMQERAEDIVEGAYLIKKALSAKKVIIAIEDNKPAAISNVERAIKGENWIDLAITKTKYPEGGEKQLIWAILKREVPSGGLPMDVGALVQNVGTTIAIYEAVRFRKPLVERVLTLSGDLPKKKGNYLVRLGTLFKDVIDITGGLEGDPYRLIMGGPMMGIAQHSFEVPVIKGTSGILVFSKEKTNYQEPYPCIRCSRCVDVCPMNLMPLFLVDLIQAKRFLDAKKIGLLDCIECGSCAYICPSHIRHVQLIKYGKQELRRLKK